VTFIVIIIIFLNWSCRPPPDACSMTISYSGSFISLLLRWKGSLWKSVWKELLIWLVVYYGIRGVYDFALSPTQRFEHICDRRKEESKYIFRSTFESLSQTFEYYTTLMPLTFLLTVVGKYVPHFHWLVSRLIHKLVYLITGILHFPPTLRLGFYIGEIVKRWWAQFEFVVWPDDLVGRI
jgi:hypothetical protein